MSVRTFADGVLVEEWVDEQAEAEAREARARDGLLARVDAALAANLGYLASVVPALPVDRLARLESQVDRLTRQSVALLRLVGDRLDDTSGT